MSALKDFCLVVCIGNKFKFAFLNEKITTKLNLTFNKNGAQSNRNPGVLTLHRHLNPAVFLFSSATNNHSSTHRNMLWHFTPFTFYSSLCSTYKQTPHLHDTHTLSHSWLGECVVKKQQTHATGFKHLDNHLHWVIWYTVDIYNQHKTRCDLTCRFIILPTWLPVGQRVFLILMECGRVHWCWWIIFHSPIIKHNS